MSQGLQGAHDAGAIFFLTDYGNADELAGVVRSVLVRLAPGAPVVDLTHEVPAFDVRAGALALERAAPHLGPGVVLGVVDPGVGTSRRAVAIGLPGGMRPRALVGPDNGLLCAAADVLGGATGAVLLASSREEGQVTFDGREVFAPAAAGLWRGQDLQTLGDAIDPGDLVRLAPARLVVSDGAVEAEVLWVDRFGNVQLSATAADGRAAGLAVGQRLDVAVPQGSFGGSGRMVQAFAELAPSGAPGTEIGLLVDANGHLALVCGRASAATVLGVQPGDLVTLRATTGGTVR